MARRENVGEPQIAAVSVVVDPPDSWLCQAGKEISDDFQPLPAEWERLP
jgi:hypothetical protein